MTGHPVLPDEPAAPATGRRIAAILASPLAGLAHLVFLQRYLRGTLLATAVVLGASLFAAGTVAWTGPGAESLRLAGSALMAVAVALSVMDTVRWMALVDHERRRTRRDTAFRQGLAHGLRDQPAEAARYFREALRLDHHQPAIRFHLAMALWRLRKRGAARRQFRRCVRWDPERAWHDEARRALDAMTAERRERAD